MKAFIKELIPYIIIILVVVLIRTYLVTPVVVSGSSMSPTLDNGEVLLLNKLKYRISEINRFDIVVVSVDKKVIKNKNLLENETKIIKRVTGLPSEYVEYKNNTLYIDGKEVVNDYNFNTEDFSLEEICNCKRIPEDKYLVLGDNREISADSRVIGLIDKDDIQGKTSFRLWPLNKIGNI